MSHNILHISIFNKVSNKLINVKKFPAQWRETYSGRYTAWKQKIKAKNQQLNGRKPGHLSHFLPSHPQHPLPHPTRKAECGNALSSAWGGRTTPDANVHNSWSPQGWLFIQPVYPKEYISTVCKWSLVHENECLLSPFVPNVSSCGHFPICFSSFFSGFFATFERISLVPNGTFWITSNLICFSYRYIIAEALVAIQSLRKSRTLKYTYFILGLTRA